MKYLYRIIFIAPTLMIFNITMLLVVIAGRELEIDKAQLYFDYMYKEPECENEVIQCMTDDVFTLRECSEEFLNEHDI